MRNRFIARCCAMLTFICALAPVPSVLAATAPAAVPFPTIPADGWIVEAIKQLSADGYLAGAPGARSSGQSLNRYELSYIVNNVVAARKTQIAQGKHPADNDVALVNQLAEAVGPDLQDLSTRVDALQTTALQTKKEADAATAALRAFQIKFNYFARPGTFDERVTAVNGPTALLKGTVAPGAVLPSGTGPAPLGSGLFGNTGQSTEIGQNALVAGNYQHGVNFQQTRLVFTGEPSQNLTYYVRLENKYQFSNSSYQSASTPAFCTSTTAATLAGVNACSSQDYSAGNTPVRLNQSWLAFTNPHGFFAKFGRWQEDEGSASSLGLSQGGNYTNGLQVGYRDKRVSTYLAYGFADTALTNEALNNVGCPIGAPNCAVNSQQLLLGMVSYDVTKHTNIGFTFDDYIGSAFTLWNPAAGLCAPNAAAPAGTASATTLNLRVACPANTSLIATAAGPVTGAYQTATTPLVTSSINLTQFITPKLKATVEYMHRSGVDPFTNSGWLGPDAFGVQVDYATKGLTRPGPLFPGYGIKGSTVYEGAWVEAGFNGLSPDSGPGGTTPYQSFFFSSLNGFSYSWATIQHWWSDTLRTGIVYHHFQTLPGVYQPAGSVTCPGCYLRSVNANALFVETYVNM